MKEEPKDIKSIFSEALEKRSPEEQAAYLDKMCENDPVLRAKVEALLKAHEQAGNFLEAPAFGGDVTLDSPRIEGPGTTIGRYKLLELIGEGGMGLVYLAEQQEPIRRRAALKIVKLGMDTKQVIARFEAEKQMLALLDHPNIARVYDAGTTETGRPYFVMEYVKGLSITDYCDQHKSSIEDRLKLFRQVCEGVQYAHQKGIIHRDIKPSNILVTVEGDRAVPKIIDFGIAKAVTQPLTGGTLFTQQGQLLGTPEYMSPEQVDMATQDIDTRCDIYSLGVVLYQLLAGVLPFGRESFEKGGFAEIQRVIQEVDPPNPSTALTNLGEEAKKIAERRKTQVVPLARRLHRELEWIPLKAMRKERVRRYRSASELADDIQNYLNGNPLIAGPETAIYRVKKFVRRHAGSVATVILVAAVIVLGLVISSAMYMRSEKALQREAIARKQAEQSQKAEKEQRKLVEQKAEDLRRSMYLNNIQLADAKYKNGDIRRVHELLAACPNDLRGWEWNRINYISDQSIMTIRGHQYWWPSVDVSPDGSRIVSGGRDKTVQVWDAASGANLLTLHGHGDSVMCVSYSPDGRCIISGSDKIIKVWDANSGKEMFNLQGHNNYVYSAVFSPDGKRIISASNDGTIKVWDSTTGAELMTLSGYKEAANSAICSPDGKRIVSAGGCDGKIKVWDATNGTEIMALQHGIGGVWALDLSPDGTRIVSGGEDGIIKVWDTTNGKELMVFLARQGEINSVKFFPDGKRIVSDSDDNMIKVWDTSTGAELMTFRGHESAVCNVVFTPDGQQIVASDDSNIKIWDLSTDSQSTTLKGHRSTVWINNLTFSSDGKYIFSTDDDGVIKVWDRTTAAETMTLRGIAISPDGKQILCGSPDRTMKILNASTGELIKTLNLLPRGQSPQGNISFSPDGKRIVFRSWNSFITLWDGMTGIDIVHLRAYLWGIGVAFSPDSRYIASQGLYGRIKVWDASTGTSMMELAGGDDPNYVGGPGRFPKTTFPVTSLSFDPLGKRIVAGSNIDTVKVWNVETGSELLSLRVGKFGVNSVGFSPDGKRIVASGRSDNTIRIWNADTGAELMTIRVQGTSTSLIVFSPDGTTLAIAHGGNITLLESIAPPGGSEPRKNGAAARNIVDELYQKYGFYYDVIYNLQADKTLDEAVRKIALQIANSRRDIDARKIVDELYQKHGFYHEVIDKLQADKTIDETVRKIALQIANSHQEKDASRIVEELYEKYGYYYEVVNRLQTDQVLNEPLKKVALQIANSCTRWDASGLTVESWKVVHLPGGDIEAYRIALEKAEKANTLEPNSIGILGALGAAQYRLGKYEDALKTLTRSDEIMATLKKPAPSAVAFIAMTLHKLGRVEEAKVTLDRLRALLKEERFLDYKEAKGLLAEAEKLIEGERK